MKFLKENKKVVASVLTLAAFVSVGEYALAAIPKTVELNVDQEVKEIETSAKTVEEFLTEQGYKLEEIQVDADLDSRVKNNLELTANTKKNVAFTNEGTLLNVSTFSNSVSEFLVENNINNDSDDIVTPALDSKITDGSSIKYDNVVVERYQKTEEIPFEQVKEYNFEMDFGKSEVKVEGKNGSKINNMVKTTINGDVVSDEKESEDITTQPVSQVTVYGSKEVVDSTIEAKKVTRNNSDMYKDQSKVVQEGSNGTLRKVFENKGDDDKKLVSEEVIKKAVDRIVEVGTKSRPQPAARSASASSSTGQYSLADFRFRGVINWSGYKFTYYSQSVLPGGGLRIPGRHVNSNGFVADSNGYIVLASNYSIPMGAVINTPFGGPGKVYDRCASCSLNWYDVYTQ